MYRSTAACQILLILASTLSFLQTSVQSASGEEVVGMGVFDPTEITDGGSLFSTITITEAGLIQDISITIEGIEHSAVGDLVAELRYLGKDGSSEGGMEPAYLFFRPNVGGTTLPGSLSNLNGDYTFSTNPDDDDFWTESAIPSDETVDSSLTYYASDANGQFLDLASEDFFGSFDTRGDWQLVISDENAIGNNVGSVQGWTVRFGTTVIPEPSAFFLLYLGCGTAILGRRRR